MTDPLAGGPGGRGGRAETRCSVGAEVGRGRGQGRGCLAGRSRTTGWVPPPMASPQVRKLTVGPLWPAGLPPSPRRGSWLCGRASTAATGAPGPSAEPLNRPPPPCPRTMTHATLPSTSSTPRGRFRPRRARWRRGGRRRRALRRVADCGRVELAPGEAGRPFHGSIRSGGRRCRLGAVRASSPSPSGLRAATALSQSPRRRRGRWARRQLLGQSAHPSPPLPPSPLSGVGPVPSG